MTQLFTLRQLVKSVTTILKKYNTDIKKLFRNTMDINSLCAFGEKNNNYGTKVETFNLREEVINALCTSARTRYLRDRGVGGGRGRGTRAPPPPPIFLKL